MMIYKFKLIIPIVIIFITNTIQAQESDSLVAQKYIEQAWASKQEQNFETSRDFALKALELNPNCGEAYIIL